MKHVAHLALSFLPHAWSFSVLCISDNSEQRWWQMFWTQSLVMIVSLWESKVVTRSESWKFKGSALLKLHCHVLSSRVQRTSERGRDAAPTTAQPPGKRCFGNLYASELIPEAEGARFYSACTIGTKLSHKCWWSCFYDCTSASCFCFNSSVSHFIP